MTTPTGLVTHSGVQAHRPPGPHPERPERLDAVLDALATLKHLARAEPQPADLEQLALVHTREHLERLERHAARGRAGQIDADTYFAPDSWNAARLATGAALLAARRVLEGTWKNAFVATRPPGHHATRSGAMGFCLVNHVAVTARAMQREFGIERVFILDWDVHHGNGTQDAFERDGSVYYASLHESPLYPHTGRASERGLAAGEGTLLNLPQPSGGTPEQWLASLSEHLLPEFVRFRPELLLISAGFDAHRADPLASTRLETETFAEMTRRVLEAAAETCDGRVVSVLEGGYDLPSLAESTLAHVIELSA